MLLGTLGDRLLGKMLAGKRIVRAGYGNKMEFASSFNKFWNKKVLSKWTYIQRILFQR